MPTFDIVSEVDMQEVRNAVDQAQREIANRFDFKGTDSSLELSDMELRLRSSTEDRLRALVLEYGKVEEASHNAARQTVTLQAGLSSDKARAVNRFIKDLGTKGVSSQTQGDQVRVSAKKRDDLQAVIAALRGEDFGIPLQFENFRD